MMRIGGWLLVLVVALGMPMGAAEGTAVEAEVTEDPVAAEAAAGDAAEAAPAEPTASPTPAPAPAIELPDPTRTVIGNTYAEVSISDLRASIGSFSIKGMKELPLPKWRGVERPEPAEGEEPTVPVMDLFNGGIRSMGWAKTDMHNFVFNGGLKWDPNLLQQRQALWPAEGLWTVAEQSDDAVLFRCLDESTGLEYSMRYTMAKERPTVTSELTIRNVSKGEDARVVGLAPQLTAINGIYQDDPSHEAYDLAVVSGWGGELEYWSLPTKSQADWLQLADPLSGDKLIDPNRIDYVGLKSRFFASLWSPGAVLVEDVVEAPVAVPEDDGGLRVVEENSDDIESDDGGGLVVAGTYALKVFANGYEQQLGNNIAGQASVVVQFINPNGKNFQVKPGAALKLSWNTTVTSLRTEHLELLTESEQQVEYADWWYRFFKMLVYPISWLLSTLASILGIYGLALICLVVIIKGALHRLNFKTQQSMMKMQKLGPELKRIQEQYKSDRQTLAMKQMELFKKEGVNPVGGCLPMLLQMPIFIALYQTFRHSADMRGQGFLWVDDLTLPDQFMPLFWGLTLNPLPFLYLIIMLAMSVVNKPPEGQEMSDQAKQMQTMMRIMPIVFFFICYNMPSGLVLYFVISAIIGFAENRYIRWKLGMTGVTGVPTM